MRELDDPWDTGRSTALDGAAEGGCEPGRPLPALAMNGTNHRWMNDCLHGVQTDPAGGGLADTLGLYHEAWCAEHPGDGRLARTCRVSRELSCVHGTHVDAGTATMRCAGCGPR